MPFLALTFHLQIPVLYLLFSRGKETSLRFCNRLFGPLLQPLLNPSGGNNIHRMLSTAETDLRFLVDGQSGSAMSLMNSTLPSLPISRVNNSPLEQSSPGMELQHKDIRQPRVITR